MDTPRTYTAFAGDRMIAAGPLEEMLLRAKSRLDKGERDTLLVFEDQTGAQIDFDLRGTPSEVIARLATHPMFKKMDAQPEPRGPGRPKLGVVSREVSLLPRHWDWLEEQRGGASATLRRLVEEARKHGRNARAAKAAREAASKFMWAMAGNLEGFEEATRALFAKDDRLLLRLVRGWPKDIKKHVAKLAAEATRLDAAATAEEASAAATQSIEGA